MTTSADLKQQYMTMVQKKMDNEVNLMKFQCKILIALLEKMENDNGIGYVGGPAPTPQSIMNDTY